MNSWNGKSQFHEWKLRQRAVRREIVCISRMLFDVGDASDLISPLESMVVISSVEG